MTGWAAFSTLALAVTACDSQRSGAAIASAASATPPAPTASSSAAQSVPAPRALASFHGLVPGQMLGSFVLVRILEKGTGGALLQTRLADDVMVFEIQPESDPRPAPAYAAGLSIYFYEPRRAEFTQREIDDGLQAIARVLSATVVDAGKKDSDAGPGRPSKPDAAIGLPI